MTTTHAVTREQHLLLTKAVQEAIDVVEPVEIPKRLGLPMANAYEVAFSILLLESRARASGFTWVPDPMLGPLAVGKPVLGIDFSLEGSQWTLSDEQGHFITACMELYRENHSSGAGVYSL